MDQVTTLMNTDACTLPTADRPLRLAEFDELFSSHVTGVTVPRDLAVTERPHAQLHLAGDPALRDRVLDLTARESSCCSFFQFDVQSADAAEIPDGSSPERLVLSVTVPAQHADILQSLVDRARELSA